MRKSLSPFVRFVVLVLLVVGGASSFAQPGTWRAYPSLREVSAVASDAEGLWVATNGGLFRYRTGTGEVTRYTTVEGLYSVTAEALAVDTARGLVWVGYGEGVLDRIEVESGLVTSYFDIARATQYTDRRINRVRVAGDSLLLATQFGVVVFDSETGQVRDTYARLGSLDPATPVTDVLVAPLPDGRPGLWLGTEAGVVYAPRDSPNLQQPSAWTLDPESPESVNVLHRYGDAVVAGAVDAWQRSANGTWGQRFFTGLEVLDLDAAGSRLLGVTRFRVHVYEQGVGGSAYVMPGTDQFAAIAIGPDGRYWLGDAKAGLMRLPELPSQTGLHEIAPEQSVLPEGPLVNAVADLAAGPDGTLWAAHENLLGFTGVSRLDADGWTVYSNLDGSVDMPIRSLYSAAVGPDGTFYGGSLGDGLVEIEPGGTVTTYRSDNSPLQPATGTSDFVVIGDAVPDADGNVWVTNRGAANPLHMLAPDGTWTALSYPPGVPTSVFFDRLAIDVFGQKWVAGLSSTSSGGRGLVGVSTGATPQDDSDDQGFVLSGSGSPGLGLPDDFVTALAFDQDDRLWIGTRRGLATIFAPGSAFGGDPSLVQPQWARTADGTSFLLRDLAINDIAIDPAGQLWLASGAGAWLLNAEGNTVLENFTPENSPLFSNSIVAVEVDPATGRVYFATDRGLLSYDGEATAPVASAGDLEIAPSPFRPAVHERGVLIGGLVARTTVRVLTLDGQLVATLDGRGGTVRWDGLDARTGAPVTSGVYLVAAVAEEGGATAYGKIAVIR